MAEIPQFNPEDYKHENGDFTDVHSIEFQDELRDMNSEKISLPEPPEGNFGDDVFVQKERLVEWLEFMETSFFKAMIKVETEHERVINEGIECGYITGPYLEKNTSEHDNAEKLYEIIHKDKQRIQELFSDPNNKRLKRWVTHHANDTKWKLESDYFNDNTEALSTEQILIRVMVEQRLRNDARDYAVVRPGRYPDKMAPQNEEELYQKLSALIDTDIELTKKA